MDCSCSKFVSMGDEYVHAVVPAHYTEMPQMECIKNAIAQAAKNDKPYDLIIADTEFCHNEIKRWLELLEQPKPGLVMYVSPKLIEDKKEANKKAADLRSKGIRAFSSDEMFWPAKIPADYRHVFDEQVELALGEEGIKRLKVESGDDTCTAKKWLATMAGNCQRVRTISPSPDVIRDTTTALDEIRP